MCQPAGNAACYFLKPDLDSTWWSSGPSCNGTSLEAHRVWYDKHIAAHRADNAAVRTAAALMGIGPVGALAAIATVSDFNQFKNDAQFGAWLGLVTRQRSGESRTIWAASPNAATPVCERCSTRASNLQPIPCATCNRRRGEQARPAVSKLDQPWEVFTGQ